MATDEQSLLNDLAQVAEVTYSTTGIEMVEAAHSWKRLKEAIHRMAALEAAVSRERIESSQRFDLYTDAANRAMDLKAETRRQAERIAALEAFVRDVAMADLQRMSLAEMHRLMARARALLATPPEA